MSDQLQRTPLYARHAESGGRLVPFAGWEMPVQYTGVIDEVHAVRTAAGLFDVSHMGQVLVTEGGAHAFLQGVLVVNAGNRDIDMAHLSERCPGDATLVDESDGHAMLALQGPAALGLLAPLCEGIDPLSAAAFTFAEARVAGVACTIARTSGRSL